MNIILIIWGLSLVILFFVITLASKKEFKRLLSSDKEKKQWKLMGDRIGFYKLTILISLLLSTAITCLIKYLFNL